MLHSTGNILKVNSNPPSFFVNSSTPFNTDSEAKLWSDKDYTQTLIQSVIKMPNHIAFFDHNTKTHGEYKTNSDHSEIAAKIESEFIYLFIIKPNRGSEEVNVFEIVNRQNLLAAITTLLNHESKDYDYILLAQQKIDIKHEFRAIIAYNQLLLVYEKDFSQAKFTGNLSPLHWHGAKAVHVQDADIITSIKSLLNPLLQSQQINYAGLDIIQDTKDNLWLIEINSSPKFDIFVRDNRIEQIVQMYQTLLKQYFKLNNYEQTNN